MMAKEKSEACAEWFEGYEHPKRSGGIAEMGNFSKSPRESSGQAKGIALCQPEVTRVHTSKLTPVNAVKDYWL